MHTDTVKFGLCHECITSSSMLWRCWKLRWAYEAYNASAIFCVCLLPCAAATACQRSRSVGPGCLTVATTAGVAD